MEGQDTSSQAGLVDSDAVLHYDGRNAPEFFRRGSRAKQPTV
jgi:hypothetical protein